jgi:D-serine deaminase-like pyridoxal phosphate-dependent protein
MKRIGRGNPPNAITCAERMIVTVVSTPTPDRLIIDAGMKCFASYPPNPYGYVVEHPEARHRFTVGERLSVVPQHQGMTTNLHDEVYAIRKGSVEAVWKVAGRGKYR